MTDNDFNIDAYDLSDPADVKRAIGERIVDAMRKGQAQAEERNAQAKADREREAAEAASPVGQARAAAHEALAAERKRVDDIAAARALIRQRAREGGYEVTAERFTDQEVLEMAGLVERQETPEQRRVREEDAIWRSGDQQAIRALELEKAQRRFVTTEWHRMTRLEREARAAELGTDIDAVNKHHADRANSMRGY